MKEQYSINEILNAINDLQKIKRDKKPELTNIKSEKKNNSDIPSNTLRLIEEAEKVKN